MRLPVVAVLFSLSFTCMAQEKYESELNAIAQTVNKQLLGSVIKQALGNKSIFTVAVFSIETEDGKQTHLTDLLEDELAVNLAIEAEGNYSIIDRNHLTRLIQEKNIPKDFGNKKDFAKNLGRVKAANLLLTGKLSSFENNYRLLITIME